MANLAHRDDLSPDMLAMLQEQFPGMKIVCAGDMPEAAIPPEVAAELAKIDEKNHRSFIEGRCLDCDVEMPGYPRSLEDVKAADDWKPADGWAWFESGEEIVAWQCPECNKGEGEMICLNPNKELTEEREKEINDWIEKALGDDDAKQDDY